MKELKFKTSKGEFKVVDEKDYKVFHLMLTMNGPEAISLKEITEEQASEIVEELWNGYKNYKEYGNVGNYNRLLLKTAIESLHSLLKSKGIHLFENPIEKPLKTQDIILCNYDWELEQWQEAEEETLYNPYIFKL